MAHAQPCADPAGPPGAPPPSPAVARLAVPEALRRALALCEALEPLHQQGRGAGGLHPGAVIVGPDGAVHLDPTRPGQALEDPDAPPPAADCLAIGGLIRAWTTGRWEASEGPLGGADYGGLSAARVDLLVAGLCRPRWRLRIQPARAVGQALRALLHREGLALPERAPRAARGAAEQEDRAAPDPAAGGIAARPGGPDHGAAGEAALRDAPAPPNAGLAVAEHHPDAQPRPPAQQDAGSAEHHPAGAAAARTPPPEEGVAGAPPRLEPPAPAESTARSAGAARAQPEPPAPVEPAPEPPGAFAAVDWLSDEVPAPAPRGPAPAAAVEEADELPELPFSTPRRAPEPPPEVLGVEEVGLEEPIAADDSLGDEDTDEAPATPSAGSDPLLTRPSGAIESVLTSGTVRVTANPERERELGAGKWTEAARTREELLRQLPGGLTRELALAPRPAPRARWALLLLPLLGLGWVLLRPTAPADPPADPPTDPPTVTLTSAPPGARLSLDGAALGLAPLELPLPADGAEHQLCAELDGARACQTLTAADLAQAPVRVLAVP